MAAWLQEVSNSSTKWGNCFSEQNTVQLGSILKTKNPNPERHTFAFPWNTERRAFQQSYYSS